MQWGAVHKFGLVAVGLVAISAAAFIYLAQSNDASGGSRDPMALTAQVGGAPTSAQGVDASNRRRGADGATSAGTSIEGRQLPPWVSTQERVRRHEALPCTGEGEPINFEVFSAGPAVEGVPMTGVFRRCDAGALADESTTNYFAYIYGDCEALGDGCRLPLQIRSYPACQRSYGEYEFEGKPLPYKELPPVGGARVREIEFLVDHRIEVYTGTSTIVISAGDWDLAEAALSLLRGQGAGEPPSDTAEALAQEGRTSLVPPVKGDIEGDPPCPV